MTSLKSVIPVYLAILACCLAVVSLKQNSLESRALRLDLKVMTLELAGNSRVIPRMGKLRNETRAKAEKLQYSVVLLAAALDLCWRGAMLAASLREAVSVDPIAHLSLSLPPVGPSNRT